MGRVELPNGLQGVRQPTTQELLGALMEQAEWPNPSEWVVLEQARMSVLKSADGTRILQVWTAGNRRGYRIPMPPITAAVIARDLGSGEAVVPESDEVAAAQAPPAEPEADGPPQPPTMGQSE